MKRLLLVFVKAPDPGRVKTRLARELGDQEAARIYRRMGRRVVEGLEGGPYRMVIYFDPADAGARIREWLGGSGMEFLAQPPGGLGDRLAHAFEWGFARAEQVCVVGTDIPDLDRTVVASAFEALGGPPGTDAVFGPAVDGGYYLLALCTKAPGLFEGIPWSTDRVLATSLGRADAAGLAVHLGPTLADVDHPSDVPPSLRSSPTPDPRGSGHRADDEHD